ncbi:MAG TPA: ABC transporter ATP-binding protein [Candidatus Nanopelagicales bacterium]|nr:ABC transporter ATP-binding protein [Candidatus Nanopelagicales bacterium]
MSLECRVVVRREQLTVDVSVQAAGGVVALVGPNGAGKSTVVRALAGLVRNEGRAVVAGRTYDHPAAGVRLAPHERSVAVVLSDPLLFPHLSVLENVAFAPRARGTARGPARAAATGWLDRLAVGDLADRRPATLSGGQAQRVALARGLVAEPDLLLLDEPFSALDVSTRWAVRRDVRELLATRSGTTLLVTHDPVDALSLATSIVVVESGRVVQAGTPAELARAPRTPYVARLVGLNLVRGRAGGTSVELVGGARLQTATSHSGPVIATFSPTAVSLHLAAPEGSARNVWPVTVASIDVLGEAARIGLAGPFDLSADVTTPTVSALGLTPGRSVWASVKATEVEVAPD